MRFDMESVESNEIQFDEQDQKIVEEILELLNDVVRPQVAMDGGDVQLKAYKDGIAYVKIKPACSSGPGVGITLHQGVRQVLIENIQDVVDVEQI
jgi:NFU1 iron-sulfur cluster scaffold homolog, mitochondrial